MNKFGQAAKILNYFEEVWSKFEIFEHFDHVCFNILTSGFWTRLVCNSICAPHMPGESRETINAKLYLYFYIDTLYLYFS